MDFGNYAKAKLILYSILDKLIKKEGTCSDAYRAVSGAIAEISDAETAERLKYEADTERLKILTEKLASNLKIDGGIDDEQLN